MESSVEDQHVDSNSIVNKEQGSNKILTQVNSIEENQKTYESQIKYNKNSNSTTQNKEEIEQNLDLNQSSNTYARSLSTQELINRLQQKSSQLNGQHNSNSSNKFNSKQTINNNNGKYSIDQSDTEDSSVSQKQNNSSDTIIKSKEQVQKELRSQPNITQKQPQQQSYKEQQQTLEKQQQIQQQNLKKQKEYLQQLSQQQHQQQLSQDKQKSSYQQQQLQQLKNRASSAQVDSTQVNFNIEQSPFQVRSDSAYPTLIQDSKITHATQAKRISTQQDMLFEIIRKCNPQDDQKIKARRISQDDFEFIRSQNPIIVCTQLANLLIQGGQNTLQVANCSSFIAQQYKLLAQSQQQEVVVFLETVIMQSNLIPLFLKYMQDHCKKYMNNGKWFYSMIGYSGSPQEKPVVHQILQLLYDLIHLIVLVDRSVGEKFIGQIIHQYQVIPIFELAIQDSEHIIQVLNILEILMKTQDIALQIQIYNELSKPLISVLSLQYIHVQKRCLILLFNSTMNNEAVLIKQTQDGYITRAMDLLKFPQVKEDFVLIELLARVYETGLDLKLQVKKHQHYPFLHEMSEKLVRTLVVMDQLQEFNSVISTPDQFYLLNEVPKGALAEYIKNEIQFISQAQAYPSDWTQPAGVQERSTFKYLQFLNILTSNINEEQQGVPHSKQQAQFIEQIINKSLVQVVMERISNLKCSLDEKMIGCVVLTNIVCHARKEFRKGYQNRLVLEKGIVAPLSHIIQERTDRVLVLHAVQALYWVAVENQEVQKSMSRQNDGVLEKVMELLNWEELRVEDKYRLCQNLYYMVNLSEEGFMRIKMHKNLEIMKNFHKVNYWYFRDSSNVNRA